MIQSLPVLVLDVYSRCNCRCVMCDIWKRETAREISVESLLRQLPAIDRLRVDWVVLTGGEPLMHTGLFTICEALKQRGIRITLLTTGLLLGRFAGNIARNIDDVIVSLDGPPKIHDQIRRVPTAFARMRDGIEALRADRPCFPISARTTVQRANCALLGATVATARELHLDSISFLAADTHSTAFDHDASVQPDRYRLTREDISELSAEVERLILSGDCGGFIVETPAKLRRIVEHGRWSLGLGEPIAPRCDAPWVSAVWQSDGAIRPCFFHPPIGQLSSTGELDRVLNGPEAIAFRSALHIASNPICRQCVCSLNRKSI
jgi:Fe-coproporphyrin III synthase